MNLTLRQKLGQKLVFAFHGRELSPEFIEILQKYRIGNVILFQRNVESADQLRRLCAQINAVITEATGVRPFIVIDQEGGMVSRLPADAVNVPCAMALGATGQPRNAAAAAEITIRQLQGLGANFNMAPVLDVNTNSSNPVIGIRSYGDDPHTVAKFAVENVKAYEGSGVLCCGKHFPGHGDTAVDSHLGLPVVDKTIEELEQAELIPFRAAIEAGIPAIMTSHILFPKIEPGNVPGTMSRTIITGLLKQRLGFRGLVISDCMEMNAIKEYYGTANGVVAAVKAGVDLAEISLTTSLMVDAAEALYAAAEKGELDMAEIDASVEKILAYKEKLYKNAESELCNRPEDRTVARELARQAVTCYDGTAPVADGDTFFCGCADYRASGVGNDDENAAPFPVWMARRFGGGCCVTDKSPDAEQIARVVEQARGYGRVILSTCNAHLFRGQLDLARALAESHADVTIVALRNPYDLPLLPWCRCRIAAYDYAADCFEALARVFAGGEMPGSLPVRL